MHEAIGCSKTYHSSKNSIKSSKAMNERHDIVSRGLGSHSDNCIPATGFIQTEIYNKQGGLAVLSSDKHPTKTGWHICKERAGHAWGSPGHEHSIFNIGSTVEAAQNKLGLKLPPLASKVKPIKKLENNRFKPKNSAQYLFNNL